jgi:hypothetical protein
MDQRIDQQKPASKHGAAGTLASSQNDACGEGRPNTEDIDDEHCGSGQSLSSISHLFIHEVTESVGVVLLILVDHVNRECEEYHYIR